LLDMLLIPSKYIHVLYLQAFLSILKNSGNREYICDAVIINSTHVLTPSECVIRLRKDASTTKKVIVTIGKPVNELRQSLDFSQARCGQEYSMDLSSLFISDSMLITLVRKGYALFRVRGQIRQDLCTCRVCLPTEDDFHRLTTSSNCYVSGFLDNGTLKTESALCRSNTFSIHFFHRNICRKQSQRQKIIYQPGPTKLSNKFNFIGNVPVSTIAPESFCKTGRQNSQQTSLQRYP
jgi:hypothetical protein